MVSNLQKTLLEAAAKEQPGLIMDIFGIAAILHDFDTVIYIVDNYLTVFPEEDREKVQEIAHKAQLIRAEEQRQSATIN